MLRKTAAALVAATLALAAGSGHGHEGHDHGEPPMAMATPAAPRAEAISDLFQLVAVSRPGALEIWLDRFADNTPVIGATIEIEAAGGSAKAEPLGDGRYRLPATWADAPGQHDLIFTVTSDGQIDVLIGGLTIPEPSAAENGTSGGLDKWLDWGRKLSAAPPPLLAGGGFLLGALATLLLSRRRRASAAALVLAAFLAGPAAAQDAPPDLAQRLPDGSVFVPKPTQRILAIRTLLTVEGEHPRTIALQGRIIPDPDASGVVAAGGGGPLLPPTRGVPHLGGRGKAEVGVMEGLTAVHKAMELLEESAASEKTCVEQEVETLFQVSVDHRLVGCC
ncbi:MAG: hypothetical protein ACOVVK_21040 [Elsteraceae bacterium]